MPDPVAPKTVNTVPATTGPLIIGPKLTALIDTRCKASSITILGLLQFLISESPAIAAFVQALMALFNVAPPAPAPAPTPHTGKFVTRASAVKEKSNAVCPDCGTFLSWLEGLVAGEPFLAAWVQAGIAWIESFLPAPAPPAGVTPTGV